MAGEGGIATGVKEFGVRKFQEKSQEIADQSKASDSFSVSWDQAKQGNFGALVDWMQHSLGYAGGQAVQMLATGGLGYVGGKYALQTVAKGAAEKLVAKEASRLAATQQGAALGAEELTRLATANVAGKIGQTVAIGAAATGMEGGEILGDLASEATEQGRVLGGDELAKAFGATLAAGTLEFVGDKIGLDLLVGKSSLGKAATNVPGIPGRAARAGIAGTTGATIEGATEFAQTLVEEAGKGKDPLADASVREAIDSAALGAVGGGAIGGGTGLIYHAPAQPMLTAPAEPPQAEIRNPETIPDSLGVGDPSVSVDESIQRTWDLLEEDTRAQEDASLARTQQRMIGAGIQSREQTARATAWAAQRAQQIREEQAAIDQADMEARRAVADLEEADRQAQASSMQAAQRQSERATAEPDPTVVPRGTPEPGPQATILGERERIAAMRRPRPQDEPASNLGMPSQQDLLLRQPQARTRQAFEAPIIEGQQAQPVPSTITPGQAFTPRSGPAVSPRERIASERERLLAMRDAARRARSETRPEPSPTVEDSPLRSAIEAAYPSVKDLHALARQKGLDIESPVFRSVTEQITGKAHLDDLTPIERGKLEGRLRQIQDQAAPQESAPLVTQQAPDAPTAIPQSPEAPRIEKADLIERPRSELPAEQNAEMMLRAEKAQADMEIAGRERGGRFFQETQGHGSTQDVIGLKSATADWYKELTTGPRPLKRQQIEKAIQKIIQDHGLDTGKAVEQVKEALLRDREFSRTPWGDDAESIMRGEWPSWIPRPDGMPPQPAQPTQAQSAVPPEADTTPEAGSEAAPSIDTEAHEAATSPENDRPDPSEAQLEAGNHKHGHVRIAGLDISISHPQGSTRFDTEQQAHYGYIRSLQSDGQRITPKDKDKESVDVFVAPGTPEDYNGPVFVIDQKKEGGGFDEHKVILGSASMDEAQALYRSNYPQGQDRILSAKQFTMPQFKLWLKAGNKAKPVGSAQAQATRNKLAQGKQIRTGTRVDIPNVPGIVREAAPQQEQAVPDEAQYQPGNPFAEKAIRSRKLYEQAIQPTAHEKAMEQAFPIGAGFGRGKDRGKKLDQRIDRAVKAEHYRRDAEHYEAKARAFDEGTVNAQGRAISAESIKRSDERKNYQQTRAERIARAKEIRGSKEQWQVPGGVWADSSGYFAGSGRNLVLSDHREAVEKALAEGKPVPTEVLADYPDLKAEKDRREREQKEISDRVKKMRQNEARLDFESKRQKLFSAPVSEKEAIAKTLSHAQAEQFLDYLQSVPGGPESFPAERAAIESVYPDLKKPEPDGEPFALTSPTVPQPKAKASQPEQLGIDVPPETVGSRPIIGREVNPTTAETEAPLFSKAAQEQGPEQQTFASDELARYANTDSAVLWIRRAGVDVTNVKQLGVDSTHVTFPSGSITFRETPSEILIDGLGRKGKDKFENRGLPTKAVKALVGKALSEGKRVRAMATDGAIPYWSGNLGFRRDGHDMIMDREQFAKIRSGEIKVYGFGEYNDYKMQPYTDIGREFFESRDADSLRARAATAERQRRQRLAAKGISGPEDRISEPTLTYALREGEQQSLNFGLAQAALDDLDQAGQSVSSATGAVDRVAGRADVKTVALGISPDLVHQGVVDLTGYRVTNAEDLAKLAQVYRDPRFETFRFIYLKGKQIVGHEGVTSRLPGYVKVFKPGTRDVRLREMQAHMEAMGADGYYLLHNHPSGRSNPSPEDIDVTVNITTTLPGFKGHVVIDSNEYSVIGFDTNGVLGTSKHELNLGPDRLLTPSMPHPLLKTYVGDSNAVVRVAKALQVPADYVTVLYRAMDGHVRAIQEMRADFMADVSRSGPYLTEQAVAFGSQHILTHYKGNAQQNRVMAAARRLIRDGILLDHVAETETASGGYRYSMADHDVRADPGMVLGRNVRDLDSERVAEPTGQDRGTIPPMAPDRGPGSSENAQPPPEPGRKKPRVPRPVWADELESVGGKIDDDGTVLLYHATTKETAARIMKDGVLRRPSDAPDSYGVYFSSSPTVAEDYGDGTIIPVRVRAADISPDDVFPGKRLDFSVKTRQGIYKPVAVGEAALRPNLSGPQLGGPPSIIAEPPAPYRDTGTIVPTTARDRLAAAKTSARPYLLGALGLQQLSDVYSRDHREVSTYNKASQQMEADFLERTRVSDAVIKRWDKLSVATADRMARVMEDARFANWDPDREKNPAAPSTEKERLLRDRFEGLPAEAKAVYREARDFYSKLANDRFDAIKQRIQRSGGTPENTKAALDKLHLAYEKVRAKVYFPFQRFGEHIVVAKKMQDGKEVDREVSAFESTLDANKFATLMKARGWTVKQTLSKEYSSDRDGSASKAVTDILKIVDGLDETSSLAGGKADLKDAINQTFIHSLPDMSYAKHFLHAKDVKGFSKDALRAFAHSALHGAHHLSRINNADHLTKALDDLDARIRDTAEGDVTEARQVYNELVQRHKNILNPNTSPVAAWLGQLGFTMSLGGVVATGFTNLTQVPLITLPWLGARFGHTKAMLALGKAYKDFLDPRTLNSESLFDASESPDLPQPERDMLKELQRRGRIDLTQTMDLAGRASQDNLSRVARQTGTVRDKIAKLLGFTFHAPEVMNRQVTALATYRLAKERGASTQEAIDKAEQAIIDTHFIYTSENRPRYMSGNVMRVLTMFKQYSQNIAFLYGRAAQIWLSGHGATAEERQIAKRQLLAMAGLQFAAAGALGMPFVGTAASLLTAILNGFGDDDEKKDWEVELRKMLANTVGTEAGEVLAHGVSRLTPWDMAGRLGQSDLFFRAPSREREGRAAAMDWATSLAGPVLSYAVNAYLGASDLATGVKDLDAGHFLRGVEELTPAVLRNGVKALRFELEGGARTRDRYKQLDLDYAEKIGQFFGFSPGRVAEMYESGTAIKNAEHRIMARRNDLLDQFAAAVADQDDEARQDILDEIRAFNQRNRFVAITGKTLSRSLNGRQRHAQGIERGTYLPRTRQPLREEGAFANL